MRIHGGILEFDEGAHAYKWDGKFVPGVTTILSCINKPALVQWSAGMASDYWLSEIKAGRTNYPVIHKEAKVAHRKKAQAAADVGSNVHSYAECWFKKQPLPKLETDQAKNGADAFHKWIDSHKIEVLASERRVFSKEFYFAGTCDFVAKIDGVLGVGDIKTSSGIWPEMFLQTAAYQQALQEEKNMTFPVRWIIRFDKKSGDFEAKELKEFDRDFDGFKAALSLHRVLQSITNQEKAA